jgi:predicted nucleotide-binding protein (sugar kinase/HSP70/actin superfamily)
MGNVAYAARALCQGLKIPYVMPEKNNRNTLRRGAFYAPEEICLPFKIMLGNFLECIEKGADTILFVGSCGPCRFGEYCELQMKILRRLGHNNVNIVVVDFSPEIGIDEFRRRVSIISDASPAGKAEKLKAVINAMKIEALCDRLDAIAYKKAGYEVNKGACKRLLYEYKAKILECENPDETIAMLKSYLKKLGEVKTDIRLDPVKIAIIGEIYTVIDPFSNLYIEEKLMDLGACSSRMLTPTWWVKDLVMKPMKLNSPGVNRAAKMYMPFPVGGHGKECVGEAVLAAKHGIDGAIQILPLGCMPEVVSKAILPAIRKDWNIPIMTMIVDEVTGEAGYVTRLEAFLDMLESVRKHRRRTEGTKAEKGVESPFTLELRK